MVQAESVSIILPAHDEEAAIGATLEALGAAGCIDRFEVIVVDDGSRDRTAEIARSFEGVRVLRHRRNRGYGAALKSGVRRARGEKILFMDSDGQHSPEKIDEVVRLLEEHAIVVGERGDDSAQVASRLMGKWLLRRVAEYLVGEELPDFNSGFRGFRRGLIRSILGILPDGFSLSTTSTLAAIKLGHEIARVPIRVGPRVGRRSSVRFFRDGARTALLILRIVMLFHPLKIFFPASLFFALLGGAWAVYGFLAASRIPNSAVILGVLGMLLFFIGLLADQISLLYLGREPVVDGPEDR